jgi:hypothetical protein
VQFNGKLCAYQLPGGAIAMQFQPGAGFTPHSDGHGGNFLEGTFELNILEATEFIARSRVVITTWWTNCTTLLTAASTNSASALSARTHSRKRIHFITRQAKLCHGISHSAEEHAVALFLFGEKHIANAATHLWTVALEDTAKALDRFKQRSPFQLAASNTFVMLIRPG